MQPSGKQAEGRRELSNEVMRLEFDPRTSDTMYNYIWVRRADVGDPPSPQPSPRGRGGEEAGVGAGQWERVHNFGIDVGAYRSDTGLRQDFGELSRAAQPALSSPKGGELINTIGMNLVMSPGGCAGTGEPCSREPRGLSPLPVPAGGPEQAQARTLRVRYPQPLIQYRQFDDKIGTREKVGKYPDFTPAEMPGLVHADASLEFLYEVDGERPSFVVSGRVLTGKVHHVIYIIDALWTDNHALPTHEYVHGVGEFDIRTPEAARCKEVEVERATFALFYRGDGDGVPFALLPQSPERARFCNYYDNWKCLHDFRAASLNQQFIPQEPPVTGCNDTGYIVSPREDGTLPGVRVAFFPELGWGRGGDGHQLRDRLLTGIREQC